MGELCLLSRDKWLNVNADEGWKRVMKVEEWSMMKGVSQRERMQEREGVRTC